MPTLAELDAAMLRPGRMAPAVNRLGGGTIAMAGTDQPLRAVGRTAVVYQLRQPSGRVLALRCALTDAADLDPSLGERYRLLGSDPGLAPFRGGGGPLTGDITYVAEGLSLPAADLRSVSHPIMAMEWVMGPTLLTATDRACRASDRTYLDDLAAALVSALTALRAAGFSHGNLAADNILVRPGGGLALVDYDTSAWPGAPRGTGLLSQPAALPGLGYAHPSGVPAPLQQRDDFPALVLYASLRVLARLPSLRQEHGDAPGRAGGVLLFNERDLREPDRSPTFGALRVLDDPPLKFLVDTLRHACHQRVAEVPAFPEVIARMDYLAVQTPSVRPAAPPPPAAKPIEPRPTAERVTPPRPRERVLAPHPVLDREVTPLHDPLERQRQLTRLNSLLLAGDEEGALRFWQESGLVSDHDAIAEIGPHIAEITRRQALRQARAAAETGDGTNLLRIWEREHLNDYRPAQPLLPLVEVARRRVAEIDRLRTAVDQRDVATVVQLWPELRGDALASRLAISVHAMLSERVTAAIAAAIARGDDGEIVATLHEAEVAGIALNTATRRAGRAAAMRIETEQALRAAATLDDRETLSALALSGRLGELGAIEPSLMRAVLRSLAWPHLERALERDDDIAMLGSYDPDLFGEDGALTPEQRARIELARARVSWLEQVRAAVRRREVTVLRAALVKPPPGSEARLSRVERSRIARMTARDDAVERLAGALRDGPDSAIVDALRNVEAAGAPLPETLDWAAIRGVADRVTLADAIREAATADPPDFARLARLLPLARAAMAELPGSRQDELDFSQLEREMFQAAHLARLRDALANDDDAAIVAAAEPDPYGALARLTEVQRARVARALAAYRATPRLRADA